MKKIFTSLLVIISTLLVCCTSSKLKNKTQVKQTMNESETIETFEMTTQSEEPSETANANTVTTEILETIKYDSEDLLILDTSEPKNIDEKILFKDSKLYPKVDGSTALLPLMAQVRSNALGINLEEAENDTTCSKTNLAWNNLFNKNSDVLIVGEMPGEVRKELEYENENKSVKQQLVYAPIRREGLVFIVNKSNPVENITKQQLIDIYTGKITNWKELGGNDAKIEAFQREEKSGSQTIFRKILMKGIDPEVKERMYYPGDMNSLIDVLASYDNSNNAIGYSVYYYVTQMYKNENLKLLKVEGVMPSNDTIADFSYPLLNESYTAIRADEPVNSPNRKLYDYIRSNQGKEAVIEAGYVPVK